MLEAYHTGASLAAFAITDTLKLSNESMNTLQTVSRENIWSAQTPQVVRKELLERAYTDFKGDNSEVTVESSLLEIVMQQCDDNQTRASEMLGINRGTLRTKLKVHKLL